MKKLILSLTVALFALVSVQAAETNKVTASTNAVSAVPTNIVVNGITYAPVLASEASESEKASGGIEITLGGGGETFEGESYFGLDFSLSTNPFESRPEVWVGIAQSLYWEPSFAGSTDLNVNWSQSILPTLLNDSVNLNLGWSGGVLYDNDSETETVWRSGPEATLQYYTSDNAFIYAGVNYDVYRSDKNEGGFRYGFGIGLSF
jgi:hypothetical protein